MIKFLVISIKLLLTTLIVFYISRTYDFGGAFSQISRLGYSSILLILSLWVFQYLIAAKRFKSILKLNDCGIRFSEAVFSVGVGVFFSNIFINFVGGDLARMYALRKKKGLEIALGFVIADRIFGLFSLLILISFSVFYRTNILERDLYFFIIPISCLLTIFISYLFISKDWFYRIGFLKKGRFLKLYEVLKKSNTGQVHIYSIGCQFTHVLIFFVIARSMGVSFSLSSATFLVPLVLLISMLPFSFAGWGIREMAVIKILSFDHIVAYQSLSISLCYGVTMVLSSMLFYLASLSLRKYER